MKVFAINVVSGTGSTGRIVTDIYHLLTQNGDQCRVAYSRGSAPKEIDAVKIGSKSDIYGHALLSRITDKQGFYSKQATRQLIEKIREYNPDIIHLHNVHGYYLNIEILFDFLRIYSKPVIWTLHDCWSFTGHCTHFSRAGCDKWKEGCSKCPQKKEYPASLFLDNSKNNWILKKQIFSGLNLTIVTVSEWLKKMVSQSFLQNCPVRTIYNGLDLEVFKPTEIDFRKEYGIEDKHLILGVANVWTKSKGIDDFMQLADMIGDDYRIVLVGVSKQQKKHMKSNMIGIENTSDARYLAGIYTAADVFVNTSVEETMGMTTVEALACCTPAIVYNATGIPEVLADMPEMVVSPHNIVGVKEMIERICETGIEQGKLLNIARKFDKWKRFQEYLVLYREVIK
jgi:glycosyltransferase involved in cell wall biosynthesis